MVENFHLLWGLPILVTKIKPEHYNKNEIINVIEKNYKKNSVRQNWSKSFFKTDIHHSLCDDENKNFEKPNYKHLQKLYYDVIENYLKKLGFKENVLFNYEIVNYTASRHKSIMEPHLHINCEFSMIHYVQFEKEHNSPTVFMNPYAFIDFWSNKEKLLKKIDPKNTNYSWVFDEWKYVIEEDDCIIFPAILKHFVRNEDTNKTRITIASNIQIE